MLKKNIIEYFEETVVKCPAKTAVIDGERNASFSEIEQKSKNVAATIQKMTRSTIRRPIAVYLEKSIESVCSDLGIVYSGNAYMNLDVKTPAQRIQNILTLVEPLLVVTDEKHLDSLLAIWPQERIIIWEQDVLPCGAAEDEALHEILERVIDTDPLCLINTSGSTGTPKSVALNNKSFIDFTEWAITTARIDDKEVIGSLSPIVFDIFSFELCMMMVKSATIVILPEAFAAFPAKLLQIMAERKVTYIFWVPTIMVNIANMDLLSRIKLSTLRSVWFAGEVFPTKQFNYWYHSLPKAQFINLYGPIEITLDCTYFIVDREFSDDEALPIGAPCRNTDILILNDDDELVTGIEEGELCVRGTSLALGYYNNPEKTAMAFVQNPLNHAYPELIYRTGDIVSLNKRGEIMFRGRKDSLIKHSGYRIELGEIEHIIINTLQLVQNGCAIYDYDKKEIVFFYESEEEIPVAELRKSIAKALPSYMIPSRFIHTDELPRNTNGKIDRLWLKESL